MRVSTWFLPLLFAGFGLGGCGTVKSLFQPTLAVREVRFEVAPKANDDSPVAVALVAVSDEALLNKLLAMSADQWFAPETSIKADYPAAALQTWYYELTPGQTLPVRDPRFAKRGWVAMLLFANYKAKGPNRLRIDGKPLARVLFTEKTIELADQP